MSGNNDFIEVPEPLFKYQGGKVVHDDNLVLLSTVEQPVFLDRKTIKALKDELAAINHILQTRKIPHYLGKLDEYKMTYHALVQDYQGLMAAYKELIMIYRDQSVPIGYIILFANDLCHQIKDVHHDLRRMRYGIAQLEKNLSPLRPKLVRRTEIMQQLKSHRAAVDDTAKTELLRQGMSEEANIIAEQITRTLSRLGFSYSYTVGKKTKTDYVQFDHVVATPDQLQFKIRASKQGLWGGSIDLLPTGVYVTDLIQPKIMNELSVSLEREVWSPHTSDEKIPLVNGAWIVVERLGLVEGIPRHVTYKQLMARYETAKHDKIPIPAGLRRGRRVNWVHLDSPSGIHLMFTGISGSGKSNAMRAMVSAVIEKQDPADINFVFIDLKKSGDFREFATVPHAIRHNDEGVLSEIGQVVAVLQRVQGEMHIRQKRIGTIANNLIDYNKRVEPKYKMPRIVVVFDEYGNTRRSRFSDEAAIIDDICIEIGQVGRAAGISLWIGIQQPRRDNMPSSLRDNITTQFVGHQANVGAAQSVTGNRDSLKLEDFPGRMSATVGWKTEKVQMPYIPEDDVKLAVQTAIDNYGEENPYQLTTIETAHENVPMTDEEIVLETAFNHFGGALKVYPMSDALKGRISRGRIDKVVKRLVVQNEVEYEGVRYFPSKQRGNFYLLVPIADEVNEPA